MLLYIGSLYTKPLNVVEIVVPDITASLYIRYLVYQYITASFEIFLKAERF